nr:immunoglobulin light chain junction region [Mus musculus]NSL97901.1 immunoglobulin light chain junction region [Mus musculus]NSL99723.1 immunoglobulin light chain junction region [Mus musculus]NSL99776.1 immunoglobulin light chain junction region [Mus musculus]NSM00135.1 immunoglobulin light chain junction region [Mus musculus]
CQHHYGTPWTF